MWPEHNNSNVCGGVLELYSPLCSISYIGPWCVLMLAFLQSCPCMLFSAVYDQAFPCPIYTQSRAYWVWARCTNDGKHSQPKRGSNPWHLSYRLRSLTTRTPSPKCLMHMLNLPFSESTQVFKWNFANTVTVCQHIKMAVNSYLTPFYFPQFSQLNASSME